MEPEPQTKIESELPVFISFSNYGYIKMAENLLRNMKDRVKYHKMVMYCLDKETYEHLLPFEEANKIELIIYDQFNTSKSFERYDSDNFKEIDHLHISILKDAFQKYDFIHFLDSDTVVLNEPSKEYYEDYKDYDIVFQQDGNCIEPDYATWTCIGNMSLRNRPGTHFLLDVINIYKQGYIGIGFNYNDQEILRKIFQRLDITDIRKYEYSKLTQYPSIHYTCGILVTQDKVDISQIKIFHANWVLGFDSKIDLLKKVGAWYLPYDSTDVSNNNNK